MNPIFEQFYKKSPSFIQNITVTLFDLNYYKRRAGQYSLLKKINKKLYYASIEELNKIQSEKLCDFMKYVKENSVYYRKLWNDIDINKIKKPSDLHTLPTVSKEDIRNNIKDISTIGNKSCYKAQTGGTTGKSLTVYYTWQDFQERSAILDSFRESYGWKLGKKTAWFSGKSLLNNRDQKNNVFWKTDYWFNIRYYSTFHITTETIPYYLQDIERFKPEFIVSFPSNIYEIAKFAKNTGSKIIHSPKTIFTTAETLVPEQVKIIEEQFSTKVYDQYASSEGAPFIVQCEYGKMHFLKTTGVIEILDKNNNPSQEGEMIITSFTTKGTPLVRYRIGDQIKMATEYIIPCKCGSYMPIVEKIEGRINDFLYSKERGKINLGNVSNCVKYAKGVIKFQTIQNSMEEIIVKLVVDPNEYGEKEETSIKKEFINKLGDKIKFKFEYVKEIEKEKSGKYMIVKSSIANFIH